MTTNERVEVLERQVRMLFALVKKHDQKLELFDCVNSAQTSEIINVRAQLINSTKEKRDA